VPALVPGQVHVWRAHLDIARAARPGVERTLSEAERRRAGRFGSPRDRDRWVAARGALRGILAGYLGTEPARVALTATAHGKLRVAGGNPASLRFSLGHSEGLAVYAVTAGREVGIDVERVREDRPWAAIAERFFAGPERAAVGALPSAGRCQRFYEIWTAKEAYAKAVGLGLALPLDEVVVVLAEPEPPRLELRGDGDPRWRLVSLDVGAGYAAALVVDAREWALSRWTWRTPTPSDARAAEPGSSTLAR
jgi:4'-phosphopantetheinyl transferase